MGMKKVPKGWAKKGDKLERTLVLKDFRAVISLVNKIAEVAEKMNHHPDLEIFDYKKLRIKISTHEAKRLTEKDFSLAEAISSLHT